eukprot:7736989-Pyramimonas_sp.AAC.1
MHMERWRPARESGHVSSQDHHPHPHHRNYECHDTLVWRAGAMAGWPFASAYIHSCIIAGPSS